MAWNDPSPRSRARPATVQPGYGVPEVRLSFLTIVTRALVALCIAGCVYALLHGCAQAWLAGRAGPGRPTLAVVGPLLVAAIAGWLVLRAWLGRPQQAGLPDRVRNGRGWFGGRRSWGDDGYLYPTAEQQIAADVVGDVIGAVIDIVTD